MVIGSLCWKARSQSSSTYQLPFHRISGHTDFKESWLLSVCYVFQAFHKNYQSKEGSSFLLCFGRSNLKPWNRAYYYNLTGPTLHMLPTWTSTVVCTLAGNPSPGANHIYGTVRLHLRLELCEKRWANQWSGRILGIIGWDLSVCKSNRFHVDILRFSSLKLGYIL